MLDLFGAAARRTGATADRGWRRLLGVLAMASVLGGAAQAQTPQDMSKTPATKIGTAPLVNPALVQNDATTPTVDGQLGATPREVVLLAQALRYERPDDAFVVETYNYVRNNIRMAWMFGLQKGGLGAIVDRSGTAFDQAELMVEVLRAGGLSGVSYQFGTITLTGAQFAQWSGVTNAAAACQLLSSGGIPASINGSVNANCAYGGDVSTITLSHVWVRVTIGAATHYFDPAFKAHDVKAGDASLAGQVGAGGTLAAATAGMQSGQDNGAQYVRSLNAANLDATLRGYARNVQCLIEGGVVDGQSCPTAGPHAAGEIEDLIGGAHIRREYLAALTAPAVVPHANPGAYTWSGGIPDSFRTKLTVKVDRCAVPCVASGASQREILNRTMFVDDIYSRKLMVIARDQPSLGVDAGKDVLRVVDEFGGFITVASFASGDINGANDAYVTLTVDHPYPTAAGAQLASGYMDSTVVKHVTMWMPLVIVNGWGDTGKAFADKWGSREDSQAGWYDISRTGCNDVGQGCNNYPPSAGDGRREQLAASWLTQSARAAQVHAALADARYAHHHSLGVVSADTRIKAVYWGQTEQVLGDTVMDSFDRVDVDTAFSLTSETADAVRRRAAVHAIAETMEILEGSVVAQVADMPDTASVATRFAWGNAPPAAEDNPLNPGAAVGPRRFLSINAPLTAGQLPLLKFEGQQPSAFAANPSYHGQNEPPLSEMEGSDWQGSLNSAINDYAALGFNVVTSEESFLGPGQRAGTYIKQGGTGTISLWTWNHYRTFQRGGALVATKYDGAEPVEIAHVVVGDVSRSKGGGGGAQPGHQGQYDPKKAADLLKSRFVDRSSAVGVDLVGGNVTYSSPAKLEVGQGDFPEKLTAEIFWRGGEIRSGVFAPRGHTEPQTPWSTNWHNQLTLSGSAMEAMGVTDIRATGGTIAAFMAMQDVFKSAPSAEREATAALVGAWWAKTLVHNVVTVNVGAGTQQFVRRFDKAWFAPGPGRYARLTQTGEPEIHTKKCSGQGPAYVTTRGWNYNPASGPVGFTVTGANGDVQQFPYWENKIKDEAFCSDTHGFRLTTWTFPKGITVTLNYSSLGLTNWHDYLVGVSNNLGRQITFNYLNGNPWITSVTDGTRTITLGEDYSTGEGRITHTDANGAVTKFTATAVGNRAVLTKVQGADQPDGAASLNYTYDSMARVSEARDRLGVQGLRAPHRFFIAHGLRGERVDPTGARYIVDYDDDKHPIRFVDELNRLVTATYDGRGRVASYTYPEKDQELTGYDDHNNPTIMIKIAKPGSNELGTPIIVRASWDQYWNKPLSITDGRNQTTTFSYYPLGSPGAGEMASATRPAVSGGTPVYTFTYNGFGQLLDATDPTGLITRNAYDGANYLRTTAVDPNGLNLVTTLTNNTLGDPVDIDGPRIEVADVSHVQYDLMRRKTVEISPDPGSGKATAKRTTYDPAGRPWKTEQGYYSAGAFTPLITTTLDLDAVGNKVRETTPAGITQFSYDPMDRLVCTAKRMGAATNADACALTAEGDYGVDQISYNDYDAAGQLEQTRIGWGVTGGIYKIGTRFVEYRYTANGQKSAVIDGVGNLTFLDYDGFDRLKAQYFPSKVRAAMAHDPTDYESYRYDQNNNRTYLRKRDGQEFTFDFDASDRMVRKIVVGKAEQNVAYGYDLAGRIASSLFESPVEGITYGYDSAKRLTSEASYGRTVSYQLDKAGNRERLTWPGGTYVEYVYDAANRLTKVREPGATSGLRLLADIHYDDLGRRLDLVRGNGGRADYTYDPAGRLASLSQTGRPDAATPQPLVQTIGYTPASQIATLSRANLNYVHTGRPPYANETYDGQNRIARFVSLSGYDANGNLTKDGVRTFTYDAENRLTRVTDGSSNLDLAYDPAGRLRSTTAGGTATYFLYADDKLVAEYGAPTGATTVRRYVHTNGVDEPIVQYDDITGGQRLWLHPDRQGSVVALSDEAGNVAATNLYTYGSWGEPSGWTGRRFGYTGQAILPEAQLYHYKARVYDPILGRFLQTDPIGQDDDPNLYAYVRGDPANRVDPDGLESATVALGLTPSGFKYGTPEGDADVARMGAAMASFVQDNFIGPVQGVVDAIQNPSTTTVIAAGMGIAESRLRVRSLERSVRSLEKRVAEHIKKLDDFKKNPGAADNKGIQANAPNAATRDKVIQGRITALEKQIKKNEGELAKARQRLEEAKKEQ